MRRKEVATLGRKISTTSPCWRGHAHNVGKALSKYVQMRSSSSKMRSSTRVRKLDSVRIVQFCAVVIRISGASISCARRRN